MACTADMMEPDWLLESSTTKKYRDKYQITIKNRIEVDSTTLNVPLKLLLQLLLLLLLLLLL